MQYTHEHEEIQRTLKRWRGHVLTSETPADARLRLTQAYDAFAGRAAA